MDSQPTLVTVSHAQASLAIVKEKCFGTDRNEEYLRYLQSQRWRTLSRAARMRAKGKCEICFRADGEECAHLTYERIFNERLADLLWLCKKCHRKLDNNC